MNSGQFSRWSFETNIDQILEHTMEPLKYINFVYSTTFYQLLPSGSPRETEGVGGGLCPVAQLKRGPYSNEGP